MKDRQVNANGNLVVPADSKQLIASDNTLGIEYVVKDMNNVYLYSTPPTKSIDDLIKQGNGLVRKKISKNDFPAVIEDQDQNPLIHVEQKLKPGQTVIALEIPECLDKNILQVVEFKSVGEKHEDLPESGHAIQIQTIGYIRKDTLSKSKKKESFTPISGDIFPNKNLMNDIRQGHFFGDCFLLASIIGILNNASGEEYIKNMMVQSPNGKQTTVRLYDPNTLIPVYITVDNTYYTISGKNTVQHGAPWVHILEKAYTALAYKKVEGEASYNSSIPNFRDIFGNGGLPATAMRILTGDNSADFTFISKPTNPWELESLNYCTNVYYRISSLVEHESFKPKVEKKSEIEKLDECLFEMRDAFFKKMGENRQEEEIKKQVKTSLFAEIINILSDNNNSPNEILEKLKKIPGVDEKFISVLKNIDNQSDETSQKDLLNGLREYITLYVQLYISNPIPISQAVINLSEIAKIGQHMLTIRADEEILNELKNLTDKPIRTIQDALDFLANFKNIRPKTRDSVIAPIRTHVQKAIANYEMDGELGTGIYAKQSLEVYCDIENKLKDSNQSNSIISLAASTLSSYGGEKVVGLPGNHCYGILGVQKIERKNQPSLLFIKIRNPWGTVGRQYDFNKQHAANPYHINHASFVQAQNAPESLIELSEFMKYFSAYSNVKVDLTKLQNKLPYDPPSDPSLSDASSDFSSFEELSDSEESDDELSDKSFYSDELPKQESSFLKKHWGKILAGGLFVSGVVVASVVTAGVLPAIVGAIAAVGVTTKVATLIGVAGLAITGLIAGAAATGIAANKLESHGSGVSGFFKRHWGKIFAAGLVIGGLAVAGIFTAGVVPAIAGLIAGGLSLCGVTIGTTVATIATISTVVVGATAVGLVTGIAVSAVSEHQEVKEAQLQVHANPQVAKVKVSSKVEVVAPEAPKVDEYSKVVPQENASVSKSGMFSNKRKGKEILPEVPREQFQQRR